MERIDFYLDSRTGQKLDAHIWFPEEKPKAVIQLVHGMAEYSLRYDAAAKIFTQNGYAVIAHSHIGHNENSSIQGHFPSDGWQDLIEDTHAMRMHCQPYFPSLPWFILGHSMGSFITRCYIQKFADGLSGVILSGTGYFDKVTVLAGCFLANLLCLFGQSEKPCPFINYVAFRSTQKAVSPMRTSFDWLSRDGKAVDQYIADPRCGFLFTASGYRELFRGLYQLTDQKALKNMPVHLPILFMSGDHDPIGSMGKGVQLVYQQFLNIGLKDVKLILYPGGRHEMLNEINKDEVEQNIMSWVEEKLL